MKLEVILVLDCGATNIRVIAVDRQGRNVAQAAVGNASEIASENSAWHQWSLEAILQRFATCCHKLATELSDCHIRGMTVTTFGADGTLVNEQGALLYPVMSWKCPRTESVMKGLICSNDPNSCRRSPASATFALIRCTNCFGSKRTIRTY